MSFYGCDGEVEEVLYLISRVVDWAKHRIRLGAKQMYISQSASFSTSSYPYLYLDTGVASCSRHPEADALLGSPMD